MKIKEMKVGELYLPKRGMKLKNVVINKFEKHASMKIGEKYIDWEGQQLRYPINADYITTEFGYYSDPSKTPLVYLGHTTENWWLPRADWFPIRKRHWCMYKGRKMILNAWTAKYLKGIGEENE
jgi:hypothetical protein